MSQYSIEQYRQQLPRILLSIQNISVINRSGIETTKSTIDESLQSLVQASPIGQFDEERTSLVLQTTEYHRQCNHFCSCQCHLKIQNNTPLWLRSLLGVLFYQFTGLPVLSKRSCNLRSCENQDPGSARFEYWFPSWLSPLIISVSSIWSDYHGICGTWSLKIPVAISDKYILYLIRSADSPKKVEQWMTTKRTRPQPFLKEVKSVFLA